MQRRVLAERVDQEAHQGRREEAHMRIARSAPERVEHQHETGDAEVERVPLGHRDEIGTKEVGEFAGIERMPDRRRIGHPGETRHRPIQPDPAIGLTGVLDAQQELGRGQQGTPAEGHGPLQQGGQRPARGPGLAPRGQRAHAGVPAEDDGGVERRLDVTPQEHESKGDRPQGRPAESPIPPPGDEGGERPGQPDGVEEDARLRGGTQRHEAAQREGHPGRRRRPPPHELSHQEVHAAGRQQEMERRQEVQLVDGQVAGCQREEEQVEGIEDPRLRIARQQVAAVLVRIPEGEISLLDLPGYLDIPGILLVKVVEPIHEARLAGEQDTRAGDRDHKGDRGERRQVFPQPGARDGRERPPPHTRRGETGGKRHHRQRRPLRSLPPTANPPTWASAS